MRYFIFQKVVKWCSLNRKDILGYYRKLNSVQRKNSTDSEKEVNALQKQLSYMVKAGLVKKGSEQWYDLKQQIQE